MVLVESDLHRMIFTVMRQPLDRQYLAGIGLYGQHCAAFYRSLVHVHYAGTALAGITTDVGSGQAKVFTQHSDEQGAFRNLG